MKTLKISEYVHKELNQVKATMGYKTFDETIDMCIAEFKTNCMPYEPIQEREKRKNDKHKTK